MVIPRQIITLLLILSWVSLLPIRGQAQGIPERTLALDLPMRGIQLSAPESGTVYKYFNFGLDARGAETIVLPAGVRICLFLREDEDDRAGMYSFDPKDVDRICRQNPYVVQELYMLRCHDVQVMRNVLESMTSQKTLERIDFDNCDMAAVDALGNIPTLKEITFHDVRLTSGESFGNSLPTSRIESLSFDNSWGDDLIGELSKARRLRSLHFENLDLANESPRIAILAANSQLRELAFVQTGLTSASLEFIARAQSVQELDLSQNVRMSDADFGDLGAMKDLKVMNIDEIHLRRASAKTLEKLAHVKILGIPLIIDP